LAFGNNPAATLFFYGTYEFWDNLVPRHRMGRFCRRFPPELNGGSISCLRPTNTNEHTQGNK
jgi:hypothetical protein